MPRVGPGGDNVTGDRYTLDLGVEPDLGNLLQNLQVANDYLDQAEQRFRTISDVVGTTTQRLAQATRQTQMLAAETQRLQNSYAQIASSTMGVANMGMGGMMGGGMPMGGMPGYGYPGQMSFSGMGSPGGGNTIQTMPSSVVRDQNAGGFEGGQSTIGPPQMPRMRFTELEQGKEFLFGGKDGGGGMFGPRNGGNSRMSQWIRQAKAGYQGPWTRPSVPLPPPGSLGTSSAMPELSTAGALPSAPEMGLVGGAARFLGTAGPYVAGAAVAARMLYKTWASQQADARQLAGLTGGEAGVAGMLGNNRVPGSIGLNIRSKLMGYLNPGVDYGEIQQRALGGGYVQGMGYEQARDYLFEAYKRGLGTTVDQMDLYAEAVDKSGASTGQLVQSMDQLRQVASNTNVSIGVLYSNMKSQVETLTGMGLAGGAAVAQATQGSVAYARSPIASLDPNLRQAGGYSATSPFMQARITGGLGIPIGGFAPYLSQNPGTNINVRGEAVAKDTLVNLLGFQVGWNDEQIDAYVAARGWGAFNADGTTILGSILQQLGILPQNYDPGEYPSIKRWIWTTLNEGPMSAAAKAARQSMRGSPISEMERSTILGSISKGYYGEGGRSPATLEQATSAFTDPLGSALRGVRGIVSGVIGGIHAASLGSSTSGEYYTSEVLGAQTDQGIGRNLANYFNQKGATTSPVLDKMMESDPTLASTYVRLENGRIIRARDWINTPGHDWQGALESGRVQIAHAGDAAQRLLKGKTGLGLENSDVFTSNSLPFNTAEDEMGAATPAGRSINGTKSRGWNADNLFGIDDRSIMRLAGAIGKEVAENI